MNSALQSHFSEILSREIKQITSVSGGDISDAFKISTIEFDYFLKLNSKTHALNMFEEEARGLEAIKNSNEIATPNIICHGIYEDNAYLILEFVDQKKPNSEEMFAFGKSLAKMHQHTTDEFGWESDNFIGSLPQNNYKSGNWVDFYFSQRLKPQLELAKKSSKLSAFECPSEEKILVNLNRILGTVSPSLLHGDLWSGNYLISQSGEAFLIDPATYYGHAEVDIAMSQLFGNFGNSFYEGYFSVNPRKSGLNERIDIYQLYYLLVHLNLFGLSYKSSVTRILNTYF